MFKLIKNTDQDGLEGADMEANWNAVIIKQALHIFLSFYL